MKALSLLSALLLVSAQAEPVKDKPKIEITATSEEPFEVKPEEKDPRKEYTEDFYGWRYLTATITPSVTGTATVAVMWNCKGIKSGSRLWRFGGDSQQDFVSGTPVIRKSVAPFIKDAPAYLASTDAKTEEQWTNEGWVICITDKAGKVVAIQRKTPDLAESYRKTVEAERKAQHK